MNAAGRRRITGEEEMGKPKYIDVYELNKAKFHPLPYTHITPTDADAESYKRGWNDAIDAIVSEAPAADVVEVCRCKDCKHYKTMFCKMDIWHKDITLYRADENDFCSYGVRKNG